MTNPTTPATVPVIQADREAAAEAYLCLCPAILCEAIKSGAVDSHTFVQSFARHRLAAEKEALERAAKVADEYRRDIEDDFDAGYEHACDRIATAIRALIPTEPNP